MAVATMTEIVDAVTVLLRAAISADVEKYTPWAPPTANRVFVEEGSETGDEAEHHGGVSGGVWMVRKSVMIGVQALWDETETSVEATRTLAESVKTVIHDNRDLTIAGADNPMIGRVDSVGGPLLVQYPGEAMQVRQINIEASWLT